MGRWNTETLADWLRKRPWGLRLIDERGPNDPGAAPFKADWDRAHDAERKEITQQLRRDSDLRLGSLRTVAIDASMLLQGLTFMLLLAGLAFQESVTRFFNGSARHAVWLVGFALIGIIGSHTPRFFKAWLTDFG